MEMHPSFAARIKMNLKKQQQTCPTFRHQRDKWHSSQGTWKAGTEWQHFFPCCCSIHFPVEEVLYLQRVFDFLATPKGHEFVLG